jgi:DNA-binding CsgD family transcriptional regulator
LITRREKEVLQLIAGGLTNTEIAERLFISIPTVNTHRKSLLEKFDAKNTAILISKATRQGVI